MRRHQNKILLHLITEKKLNQQNRYLFIGLKESLPFISRLIGHPTTSFHTFVGFWSVMLEIEVPSLPRSVETAEDEVEVIKVGHGGTLDPLATGVLVIGVGKGTKEMQG